MAERFNRKPELQLGIDSEENDSTSIITTLAITNKGSLLADIFAIRIQVPNEPLLSFKFEGFNKDQEYEEYSTYQRNLSNSYVVPSELKPRVFRGKIVFDARKYFQLTFLVYYRSDFGNDGVSEMIFRHSPKK